MKRLPIWVLLVVVTLVACSPTTRRQPSTVGPMDLFAQQDTFLWRLRLDAQGKGSLYRTGLNSAGSVTWVTALADRKAILLRPDSVWIPATDSFRFQGHKPLSPTDLANDDGQYDFRAQVYTDTFFRRPLPKQYLLINSDGPQGSNHAGGYTDEEGMLVLGIGSHDITFGARIVDSTVVIVEVPAHLRKMFGKDTMRMVTPIYDKSTIRRIRPNILLVMPDSASQTLDTTFQRWDVTLYRQSRLQPLPMRQATLRNTSPSTWGLTLQAPNGTMEIPNWQRISTLN